MRDKASIHKRIKMNSELNPYSDNFETEPVLERLKTIIENDLIKDNKEVIAILYTLPILNNMFKGYYSYLSDLISDSTFNLEDFLSVVIGFVNGNYVNLGSTLMASLGENFTQFDISEFRVKSTDETLGDVHAIASLEAQIDGINNIFSHLRFFLDKFKNKKVSTNLTEVEILNQSSNIANAILNTNAYKVIKDEFEEVIWNDGIINFDASNKGIHFQQNEWQLAIRKAGLARVERLLIQNHVYSQSNKGFKELLKKDIEVKRQNLKRIKSIEFENGALKIKLAKGLEKKYIDIYISTFTELATFYQFIIDKEFSKDINLSVRDCIILISHLKLLFDKITEQLTKEINEKEFIKYIDIPSKISYSDLEEYLTQKFDGKNKKVKIFLSLITQNLGNRISFWKKPLLKVEQNVYTPLLTLTSPNFCYLLDEILESGGFDLDRRGKYFEEFLGKDISNALTKKGYWCNVYSSKNVVKGKKYEEVDLILELKNVILIAEIKCIKYSITGRDYSHAYKTLKKAASQIIRKSNFIKKNNGFFDNISLDLTKPLITIVLNQYPLFTGTIIDDIPILDYPILESYFKSGKFGQSSSSSGKFSTMKETKYYTNETSFNQNLYDYVKYPTPIKSLINSIEFKIDKITPKDSQPQIFTTNPYVSERYELDNYGIKRGSI